MTETENKGTGPIEVYKTKTLTDENWEYWASSYNRYLPNNEVFGDRGSPKIKIIADLISIVFNKDEKMIIISKCPNSFGDNIRSRKPHLNIDSKGEATQYQELSSDELMELGRIISKIRKLEDL